jgi:predicted nuclease of restriction endonuclease-like (RecB) superfamily
LITAKKYRSWLAELKADILQCKLETALQVNRNMLIVYWYIGKQIDHKIQQEGWGSKIIEQLSTDWQKTFPDLKGFSARNLLYRQQFSVAYPNRLITQQPVAQLDKYFLQSHNVHLVSIPWGHHTLLLDKVNDSEERSWYIKKTVEEKWSRNVLHYQLQTDLYKRQHPTKKASTFHLTLPKAQGELANAILKNPYQFDFLNMGDKLSRAKPLQDEIKGFLKSKKIKLSSNRYALQRGMPTNKEYDGGITKKIRSNQRATFARS